MAKTTYFKRSRDNLIKSNAAAIMHLNARMDAMNERSTKIRIGTAKSAIHRIATVNFLISKKAKSQPLELNFLSQYSCLHQLY